ncbi:MAG: replicative DNA helicase, partial [Firmicutes bacterium]|nr:replicative DNA helicase [Bacillota bacterium]
MPQIERIPPHSEGAEKSVLGSLLIDKESYFKVSDIVKPDDFYYPAHKEIYEAMLDLASTGQPIDIVTVTEALVRRKGLETAGGRAYVSSLSQEVPTTANAADYAKLVAEKAVLRRLISAAADITEKSYAEDLESKLVLDHAEQVIFDIAKRRQSNQFDRIQDVLETDIRSIREIEKNGGKLPGLPSGFTALDRMTSGFQNSDLVILAARPSMGKSALMLNIAQNAAIKQHKRVVIFSLEMSSEQLGMRLLAMEARVELSKMRNGTLTQEDWDDVNGAIQRFSEADLVIDDTPGIGVMEMRNKCRRLDQEKKIDLIMVDYLQMMSADQAGESRQGEISQISRYLKQLAREMNCPLIALSQLSRAVEQRQGDKRPILSDLRESGAIEQDADIVMFLFREDYYNRNKEGYKPNNICEVLLAKQRMGE